MNRWVWSMVVACMASAPVAAHFVFVVPERGTNRALTVLSETPKPDPEVDVAMIAGTKLTLRDLRGKETPVTLSRQDNAFALDLPKGVRGVVHGMTDLGVTDREGGIPHVLLYYPKAIIGDPFDARTQLGARVPIEIVPVGSARSYRLRLLVRGEPVPQGEMTVIGPDGSQGTIGTNADGLTGEFSGPGRYAAWARYWESTPGERNGRRYQQLRHYATVVFEVPGTPSTSSPTVANRYATLPEEASSFGAAVSDGWLYVYGGHVVRTHRYSTASVSGRFNRLRLDGKSTWESLPGGTALQGMNLVAHAGRIYRVGGMQPINPPGQAPDLRSVSEVARFDPSTGTWNDLAPLPSPRSSHDVVVVGNNLIVVGGWNLQVEPSTSPWADTLAIMDLSASTPQWRTVPQPFKRRALIAAELNGLMYVMGGMDERNRVERAVSIYDPIAGSWSKGPDLPGGEPGGFAPAAVVDGGRLFVSLGNGAVVRLNAAGTAWDQVGTATRRVAHRMVAHDGRLFILGGASGDANLALVETLSVTSTESSARR